MKTRSSRARGKTRKLRLLKDGNGRSRVFTRIGNLHRLGTNEWGKALVECPECGAKATAGKAGAVWCMECGFSSAVLVGCG